MTDCHDYGTTLNPAWDVAAQVVLLVAGSAATYLLLAKRGGWWPYGG